MSHPQTQSEVNTERQKQALLRQLLQKKGIKTPQQSSIPRRDSTEPCPLSFAQERLWFLDQLEPHSTAYNLSTALSIKGLLRSDILERSFNEVVRRHEILRTSFTHRQQQAVQVIHPNSTISLPVINLQHLPLDQQTSEVQRLAIAERSRTFNLAKDCLFAITLLQLNPAEHVLLFTLHHIISDGWSSSVLCQEIGTLYQAFSRGTPSPLPELSIQYADFALWQRGWLQGEVLDTQLNYWIQQLQDAPPVLELPTDHPRPAIQTANGAMQSMEFSLSLSESLKTVAYQESATLYMVLLAAFKVLLYRYTGQTDILVGSAIANRNRLELEGLIGFFVNTLVLRTQLSDSLSFRELLAQVRKVTLDAYEHQDLPFEKLVAELKIERNLSYQPLFQIAFELQNRSTDSLTTSELTFEALEIEDKTAKYDLTLFMSETAQGLIATFEYNTDLFEAETITQMLAHYQVLLESITINPDQTISTLPLLSQFEQQQLLIEWNNTDKDYPLHQTVHRLFEAQVERTPDATAIICQDQCIRQFLGKSLPLAERSRSQLDFVQSARYCALSGAEGCNIGAMVRSFLGIALLIKL
ncbi:MAG: hypothetical protein HC936_08995 [Leptolyngbyaceae cyanobacterium SU_3_3]|nr:hypothetical protein [Leptolyngbyaceae cyanobacterium SU_3_3]